MYWERDGEGGWVRTAMGETTEVDPAHPVVHVDWHQADAFARWAGGRLPTELEWEAAAAGADRERANLDLLAFGTAPAGAYGDAPSECGAVQMLGDVWEWTSSDFAAYPGFEAVPVSRVLGGLLRRRVQGASRRRLGDPARCHPHQLPQLGPAAAATDLFRPALRKERSMSVASPVDRGSPAGGRPAGLISPPTCAWASRVRSRSCRRSTSTTSADRACSSRSRRCPSTTRRAASARSSTATAPRSSPRRPSATR